VIFLFTHYRHKEIDRDVKDKVAIMSCSIALFATATSQTSTYSQCLQPQPSQGFPCEGGKSESDKIHLIFLIWHSIKSPSIISQASLSSFGTVTRPSRLT